MNEKIIEGTFSEQNTYFYLKLFPLLSHVLLLNAVDFHSILKIVQNTAINCCEQGRFLAFWTFRYDFVAMNIGFIDKKVRRLSKFFIFEFYRCINPSKVYEVAGSNLERFLDVFL